MGKIYVRRGSTLGERLEFYSGLIPPFPSDCINWKGSLNKDGYGTLGLEGQTLYAHRAAWMTYRGSISAGKQVLHQCDNPSCINPRHLFLGTRLLNMADMVSKKRHRYGEKCSYSKLTESQVIKIRSTAGSQQEIAEKYNVSQMTISSIKRRKTWAHVL